MIGIFCKNNSYWNETNVKGKDLRENKINNIKDYKLQIISIGG